MSGRRLHIQQTVGLRAIAGCAAMTTAVWPGLASAHAGQPPPTPDTIWSHWSVDPLVILGVMLGSWLYGAGMVRLWRRSRHGHRLFALRSAAFAGGVVTIAVALVTPLDGLAEALFAAHMVQHLLLLLVAPPLLVLSKPLAPVLWSLHHKTRLAVVVGARRRTTLIRVWHALNRPLVAWLIATTILWVWHVPALYDAAVRHGGIHALEHACFLGSAMLFWWVVGQQRGRRTAGDGISVLYLFAAGMQSGILGALMTFSATPWYSVHATSVGAWGLTPLEDQQLAGLIMWIPASVVYLAAAAVLFVDWLRAMDESSPTDRLEVRREAGNRAPANQTG